MWSRTEQDSSANSTTAAQLDTPIEPAHSQWRHSARASMIARAAGGAVIKACTTTHGPVRCLLAQDSGIQRDTMARTGSTMEDTKGIVVATAWLLVQLVVIAKPLEGLF